MEQPLKNNTEPSASASASLPASEPGKKKQKRKLPSPRELVSHYEAQGMETQEASLKVIEDLQNALFRMMVSSSSAGRASTDGPRSSSENSKKLDVIGARLLQLEMKVDSKPGYAQSIGIGVASGALLRAAGQIWTAEKRIVQEIAAIEKDTGYKLRVLAQNYPDTPGLAIRDFWNVDDRTIVFVADPTFGNILNFNIGASVDLDIPRSFWSRLAGKYGNIFYWKEKGEDASIEAAVMAIANCLREPVGSNNCAEVK